MEVDVTRLRAAVRWLRREVVPVVSVTIDGVQAAGDATLTHWEGQIGATRSAVLIKEAGRRRGSGAVHPSGAGTPNGSIR